MTAYFDVNSTSSTDLLVKAVRTHDELATTAADAETDVVAHFSRRYPSSGTFSDAFYAGRGYYAGNGVWVSLLNYLPDAASCTDAGLVLALRRTIADVVTWRLGKRGEALHVESQSALGPGTYKRNRPDFVNPFPPGDWPYRLRNWDIRTPVYVT